MTGSVRLQLDINGQVRASMSSQRATFAVSIARFASTPGLTGTKKRVTKASAVRGPHGPWAMAERALRGASLPRLAGRSATRWHALSSSRPRRR